jgi:hypothetical protein
VRDERPEITLQLRASNRGIITPTAFGADHICTRVDNPVRLALALLGRWFDWRDGSTVVRPRTFVIDGLIAHLIAHERRLIFRRDEFGTNLTFR